MISSLNLSASYLFMVLVLFFVLVSLQGRACPNPQQVTIRRIGPVKLLQPSNAGLHVSVKYLIFVCIVPILAIKSTVCAFTLNSLSFL